MPWDTLLAWLSLLPPLALLHLKVLSNTSLKVRSCKEVRSSVAKRKEVGHVAKYLVGYLKVGYVKKPDPMLTLLELGSLVTNLCHATRENRKIPNTGNDREIIVKHNLLKGFRALKHNPPINCCHQEHCSK